MRENIDPASLRVCYFNIAPSDFSRSGVHMQALMQRGVQVLPCVDSSSGVRKFWEIFKKHRALAGRYDVIIVGYPAYILVPFARLISRKPIIFDAGWSLYEGTIVARGLYAHQPLRKFYYWLIDWLSSRCANTVLLESDHQIAYYQRLFRVPQEKLKRLFTGVSEEQFFIDPTVKKRTEFAVLFRGYANPEAGVPCLLEAARRVVGEGIHFCIISPNLHIPAEDIPSNVELHQGFFALEVLRTLMQECHVSVGQLAQHERLERTIPHKAFESMLLKLPFVTADAVGIREILDAESATFITPGDAEDLAQKLREMKDNPTMCASLTERAHAIYMQKCANRVLGEELRGYIASVVD